MLSPPPSSVPFVILEKKNDSWYDQQKQVVLGLLQISEPFQRELSRALVSNCYSFYDRLICNFEALYSITRLTFALSSSKQEDWKLVSNAIESSPHLIFNALGLEVTEWYTEEQFFIFSLEGVSAHFAADLSVLGRVAGKFAKSNQPKRQ